jgi:hypothetical protein
MLMRFGCDFPEADSEVADTVKEERCFESSAYRCPIKRIKGEW